MIPAKPVYSYDTAEERFVWLGVARTWSDVATLLNDRRPDAAASLSREHSESRTAFYLKGETS